MKTVNSFIMRAVNTYDHFKINGMMSLLGNIFYYKRKAKIIERELNAIEFKKDIFEKNNIRLEEANNIDFIKEKYFFTAKNRYYKCIHYLNEGYGGHLLIKDNEVIGDVWYYPREKNGTEKPHNDIKLLKLNWDDNYVYSFDIFVSINNRGNNIGALFMNNHLYLLSKKGFKKVYWYFWEDNLPAMWIAKVLSKCKEIGKIKISRFFIIRMSH